MEAGGKVNIEALGKRIAGQSPGSSQPLMRRLTSTIDHLNRMHYQARWEAGAEGPRIVLGHCPYSAVIERHPELCRMDTELLGNLVSGKVRQTVKLESGAGGVLYCAFVFSQK